jgi:cobalt/nickel transport system permease protein
MTLAFDLPPCTDSPLSRRDPRWKLAALAPVAVAASFPRTWLAVLLALVGAILLGVLAKLPWRWYRRRLAVVLSFLAVFVVPLPFLLRGDGPSWGWPPYVLFSLHGANIAALLVVKTTTVLTLVLVMLATAPLDANLKAAHCLRVPGLLVQLGLLSYRYLFVLSEELERLRVALRVRAFRSRVNAHTYRTVGHVAGTLLVRGHERAERVSHAMRCRGFDGTFRSLTEFRTTAADVLLWIVVIAAGGGILTLDLLMR